MAKDKKTEAPAEVETKKKKKSKAEPEAPAKKAKGDKSAKVKSGFAKPSEAPATGGDGWNFEDDDNVGKLYLITPLSEDEHDDSFNPGQKKKHIVADIVEINVKKPAKSELHSDAWVFGGWTRGALRGFIGEQKVLGRLNRDESKAKGKNIPWVLEDASATDIEAATEYINSVDVFKVKK
jgi:hypothetical protein